jgi:N,N-dimethylformamidase
MPLIGFVSDERFVALPNVLLEFEGEAGLFELRSTASGRIHGALPSGRYRVTLAASGHGSKCIELTLPEQAPHHFRLLRDGLLGYIWPKWVRAGEPGEFRVHADQPYHLSLWRYGLHKEPVQPIGWFDEHGPRATVQVTPDGDYSQTGVQWNKQGYASPHHKQLIAAPSRSGLYYFHAKDEAGKFFSFPWIVAPDKPTAPIAVLASNINWNAYNSFGGRSNYIHPDALPNRPTVNARYELRRYTDPEHVNYDTSDYAPLSFDRPEPINHVPESTRVEDPIAGRAACHLAPTDWRLLGWLERESIAHDLYAETQLHFGQLDLDAYQVLVLTSHPEYWSRQMYDRVKRWVFEQGGRLVYLGGNGLNCDVEFRDEQTCIYRNEDNRRLKEPGTHWESRFHLRHESEANLLGVVFDWRGVMTAAPYRVVDAAHWVFAGTGLGDGETFGRESLHERIPGGASGHETDKRSPSSPANTQLLAKGLNPDEGGAEMVIYDTSSGGGVFSTGSICWIAALLVDQHVSRITANVLRNFTQPVSGSFSPDSVLNCRLDPP